MRELFTEVMPRERACREALDRLVPRQWQGFAGLLISVARGYRRRLELARESMVNARQDPSGDEIGVGIRARQPVFEPQVGRVGSGYAHRGAAIVDRPGGMNRHVGLGTKTP